MSNIIDKIQVSGVTYDIGGTGGGGNPTVELTQAEYDALVTAGTVSADTYYIITDAQAGDLTNYYTKTETNTLLGGKQATLVSGTNIKTINNESILGSGNIEIEGGGGSDINVVQTTGTSTTDVMSQDAVTTQLNGKGDAISFDMVTAPQKKVTFQMKRGGINGTTISSRDLTLGRGLVYGEEDFTTLSTSGLVETSAITTSISSSSTDAQVPSAKAVYHAIQEGGGGGGGMTEDDELLLSTALTDLNDRKIDASEVKSNYQKKGDYVTTNTLNTRLAEYETALEEQNVEEVTAYALNDLNNKFGGLKLVKITESEYAGLTTKDENTLYIVVADPS